MVSEPMNTLPTEYTFATDVTPTSWQPSTTLTFDEWEQVGNTLLVMDKSLNWWIGDWICYGENKWGEMYLQAQAITGWNYDRLARAKWVASKVPFWLRTQNLSWTAHLAVAPLPPNEQKKWLDKAEAEGLHSAELKKAIKAASLPAPTVTAANGYGPHADIEDDVPYSASGPGVVADAPEWVEEYEGQSVNDDLPVLSWETMAEVKALVTAVLLERWTEAVDIAEKLEAKIG
jgi:hypothetical protein